jgi:hypothetical protein
MTGVYEPAYGEGPRPDGQPHDALLNMPGIERGLLAEFLPIKSFKSVDTNRRYYTDEAGATPRRCHGTQEVPHAVHLSLYHLPRNPR